MGVQVGFQILDLDRDGRVELYELSELLENWGLPKGEARRVFKRLKLDESVTPEQWVGSKGLVPIHRFLFSSLVEIVGMARKLELEKNVATSVKIKKRLVSSDYSLASSNAHNGKGSSGRGGGVTAQVAPAPTPSPAVRGAAGDAVGGAAGRDECVSGGAIRKKMSAMKVPLSPRAARHPVDEEVLTAFAKYDVKGEGNIDMGAFKQLLSHLGFDGGEVEVLFETGDLNQNGSLTVEEFAFVYDKLRLKLAEHACDAMRTEHAAELHSLRAQLEVRQGEAVSTDSKAKYEEAMATQEAALLSEREHQKKRLDERRKMIRMQREAHQAVQC